MKNKLITLRIKVDEWMGVQRLINHLEFLDGVEVKDYKIKYEKDKAVQS